MADSRPRSTRCSVFLSHAGGQKDFVYMLRKALRDLEPNLGIFLDEVSIERSAVIWDQVQDGIWEADVVVLVLSEDFLRKPWPMAELHLVMERWRKASELGTTVQLVPVVKGITCEDVAAVQRHYSKVADDLEHGAEPTDLHAKFQWLADSTGVTLSTVFRQYSRNLEDLMDIAAVCSKHAQGEVMCQQVVEAVMRCLARTGACRPTAQLLHSTVVLADSDVDSLKEHVTCGAGQQAVLLTGMAGMGKSVLAKRVFEQLVQEFPHMLCCYVDMKHLVPRNEADVIQLQQSVLDKLAAGNGEKVQYVHTGFALLSKCLQGRQVLMLLDNAVPKALDSVLPHNFLRILGQGSMVLVTSRVSQLSSAFGSSVCIQMQRMSSAQSRELLCHHAGLTASEPDQQAVADILLRYAGWPWALTAIGKHLAASKRSRKPGWLAKFAGTALHKAATSADLDLAQLRHSFLNSDAVRQDGCQPADMDAMLKDNAFFFAQQDCAPQLLLWCFMERSTSTALQETGLFDSSEGLTRLNIILVDLFKALVDNESKRVKKPPKSILDLLPREDCKQLEGLWVHGPEVLGQDALEQTVQMQGEGLRLLQLGCGLQGTPLLKPCSSGIYLVGIGAGVAAVKHPTEAIVDLTYAGRPPMARTMVLLHGSPHLAKLHLVPCKHVQALWVSKCPALSTIQLAQLGSEQEMENLKKLHIMSCPQLLAVEGLDDLELLELRMCGCSLPAVGHQLADCEFLESLVLQPCSHCKLGACISSAELHSLSPTACSNIDIPSLKYLTRLELCPEQHDQQQQQQREQHNKQPDIQQVQDQGTSASRDAGRSVCAVKDRAASTASSSSLPPHPHPLLAVLQCLEVIPADSLQDSTSAHSLGHVVIQQDPHTHHHSLQLADSAAVSHLHIPATLEAVHVTHCAQLSALLLQPLAAGSSCLRTMVLKGCPQLATLPPELGSITALARLELHDCPRVSQVSMSTSLRELQLHSCSSLHSLVWPQHTSAPAPCSLTKLRVSNCPLLTSIPEPSQVPSLALLDVSKCGALQQLHLGASLVRAYISSCDSLTSLQAAAGTDAPGAGWQESRLQVLRVHRCTALTALAGVPELQHLAELKVGDCAALQQLVLSRSLHRLSVDACPALTCITPLAAAELDGAGLQQLSLAAGTSAHAWRGQNRLHELTIVVVSGCPQLQLDTRLLPHPSLCKCEFNGEQVTWQ